MPPSPSPPPPSTTALILTHILPLLPPPTPHPTTPPFTLALSGIQGSGKSTLTASLLTALSSYGYTPLALSLDDFYLPYADAQSLAHAHPGNKLLQQRGQPGTHDALLAESVMRGLRGREEVRVPVYDKAGRGGRGDRVGWRGAQAGEVDVLVLEGWCVGFLPLGEVGVRRVYAEAVEECGGEGVGKRATGREVLLEHGVEDLVFVDGMLGGYTRGGEGFMDVGAWDAVVHLDAERLEWVYGWRVEQERGLRGRGGGGMMDEEVEAFGEFGSLIVLCGSFPFLYLDWEGMEGEGWESFGVTMGLTKKIVLRYMPAYVLYLDNFRKGVCKGRQLRIVLGKDREVKRTEIL